MLHWRTLVSQKFHPGKLGEGVSYRNDAIFFTNALKIGNPPTQSCSVNAVLFVKCFAVFKGFMVRLAWNREWKECSFARREHIVLVTKNHIEITNHIGQTGGYIQNYSRKRERERARRLFMCFERWRYLFHSWTRHVLRCSGVEMCTIDTLGLKDVTVPVGE